MNQNEHYLHFYRTDSEFEADYNGSVYHEDWVSYTLENEEVHYNKDLEMSVQELIDNGYEEIKKDSVRAAGQGSEVNYYVIQIHSNCPVKLENITNFDEILTSATTFVWREELPSGWKPSELAAKYNGAQLYRPISPEMFPCVDLSGVDELSLSFAGGSYQTIHSSIISQRYAGSGNYYPNITFKTPKHLTVNIRSTYSSVAQTNFSMLNTTTGITINCGIFSCHDVTGMFEHDVALEELVINGSFRWDAICLCHLMFDGDNSLKSIPYVTGWGRESTYNTIYPHAEKPYRGSASCGGLFNATGLESIGPVINMSRISVSGYTSTETYWDDRQGQMVTGPVNQGGIPYDGKPMFNCPNLTDVSIINLSHNDWNFADGSTYTYIPKMDVTSIEYLLNHVEDCSSDPHTVTFSTLHQGEISSSAINAAAAKGWTVQTQ
jgi:hypothetical protein